MNTARTHFPSRAQLHRGGTSVIVDLATAGTPTIIHWGPSTGVLSPAELESLAVAARPQRVSGGIDIPARLTLLPQEVFGWQGSPALVGQRATGGWASALSTTAVLATDSSLTITAQDSTGRHLKERTAQRRPLTVGAHAETILSGRLLAATGLQSPVLFPEQAVLITADQAN